MLRETLNELFNSLLRTLDSIVTSGVKTKLDGSSLDISALKTHSSQTQLEFYESFLFVKKTKSFLLFFLKFFRELMTQICQRIFISIIFPSELEPHFLKLA